MKWTMAFFAVLFQAASSAAPDPSTAQPNVRCKARAADCWIHILFRSSRQYTPHSHTQKHEVFSGGPDVGSQPPRRSSW